MRLIKISSIVILSFLFVMPACAEEVDQCGAVLAAKTINIRKMSRRAQLDWVKLLDKSEAHTHQQELGAAFPGYFSGSASTFDDERSHLFQQESYHKDVAEASSELSIETGPEAVGAWETCTVAHSNGLFARLKNVDCDGANLEIDWNPPPGLGQMTKVVADFHGIETSRALDALTELDPGAHRFVLERKPTNHAVRGTITGSAGQNGAYSIEVYIPTIQARAPLQQFVKIEDKVGMGWDKGAPTPYLVLKAGNQGIPVGLTPRREVCIEADAGFALQRNTITVSPRQTGRGCLMLCPESSSDEAVGAANAGQCAGNQLEHRICFSARMSVDQGESCVWEPYAIAGQEIEEAPTQGCAVPAVAK